MFKSIFGFGQKHNRHLTDALYEAIVAAARQPHFYSAWNVPDIPLGRYEMLSLHMFLMLERLRGQEKALEEIGQELADEFFKDMDHSLRELGVGDISVPKRMKRLARMFYGRAEAYREACANADADGLAAALSRNIRPQDDDWPQAVKLAVYVLKANAMLAAQPDEMLLAGHVAFPVAEEIQEAS